MYKKGIKFIYLQFIELIEIWKQMFNYGEIAIIKSQIVLNINKNNFKLEKG